jgi:hypothetical protein
MCLWPALTGQSILTKMLTATVKRKAAIWGWAGQMTLLKPVSQTPRPAAVAIKVAARVLFMDILADAESFAENYAGLCGFVPAEHFYPPGRYCQWGRQYRAR